MLPSSLPIVPNDKLNPQGLLGISLQELIHEESRHPLYAGSVRHRQMIYVKPVKTANHKLRSLYGIVGGVPHHSPEGSYALRYNVGSKRVWDMVGADPELANAAFNRKMIELQAGQHGISIVRIHRPCSQSQNHFQNQRHPAVQSPR